MLTTIASVVALALSGQPPAAANRIEYVPVSAPPQAELMRAIERALPDLAPRGVSVRRARLDTAPMEACLTQPTVGDRSNACIRALLPSGGRNGPVIALRVTVQTVCDITGRRCHYRHQLHCIGARSIGTAALGDHQTPAGDFRGNRPGEIRACLVTAMTPRNASALSRDAGSGAPLWRFPLTRYIPDNAAHARGRGAEQALVIVQEVRRRPGRGGQCLMRAHVGRVEGYFFLRAGDLIELSAPCSGEARAGFDRAVAPALVRGSRGRIFVDFDGQVLLVEPLPRGGD